MRLVICRLWRPPELTYFSWLLYSVDFCQAIIQESSALIEMINAGVSSDDHVHDLAESFNAAPCLLLGEIEISTCLVAK